MPDVPRILVIDDDVTVAESIGAYLEDAGFVTNVAHSGRDGIDIFRLLRPDVVVSDLRMPNVDGLEVLATVAADAPQTPVIVTSGAGLLDDAVEALKLGAWDYVTKPIMDMTVLAHAVNRALERVRLIRQNERYKAHLEASNRWLRATLRRLREEEAAGRQVQFRMLPEKHTRLFEYDCCRAIWPSALVSGDFVDCFGIGDNHIGFYVADVAGHGVSSAFVTVLLKSAMGWLQREHADRRSDTILSPKRVLERLNQEVLRQGVGKHLTMFYGVIERSSSVLTFGNGGQYPWPILHDGSSPSFLEAESMPVGLFDFADFEERRVALPDPFALTMCSDGVLEVLSGEGLAGKNEALLAMVSDMAITVDDLSETLDVDTRGPLVDDLTVLMVKRGVQRELAA